MIAPEQSRGREFRVLEVVRIRQLTPRMRRITFGGPELEDYALDATAMGPHVKLLLPSETTVSRSAGWEDLKTIDVVTRTYTVRRFDPNAIEVDVDFVMHGDEGVASRWAAQASVGDRIGFSERFPLLRRAHDWYFILGDLTALPAIAQILENLPTGIRGQAAIMVDDPADRQVLQHPDGIDLVWIERGDEQSLLDRVRDIRWDASARPFIWVGIEAKIARAVRRYVRSDARFENVDVSIVNYWKRGEPEQAPLQRLHSS